MSDDVNDQLVLICGAPATGKSASLMNIRGKNKWMYLNAEAGKRLPFKNDFMNLRIEDPYQVNEAFDHGTDNPNINGCIIDSMTFLMDMYETQYVLGSANTMQGWSNYQQYFKILLQSKVVRFKKPVIITAHIKDELDEKAMEYRTSVPVKGALKNNGIEAYFSTIVYTKKVALTELEGYKNPLLNITEDDEMLGYKHVFQTRPTKQTAGERIRSPMGMFPREQTYIDNDAQVLLDHLDKFYKS